MGTTNINLLKPGYLLHWYKINTVLGQGGFGITYLAEDQNLQEKVAIKEYYPGQFATRTEDASVQHLSEELESNYRWGLDRFISEARTLTQFRHSSIVRVRNVFKANNTAYMVMDFVEGPTLASKLKGRRTLPENELLAIFLPLLEGLELMHETGYIHRDIKPDNIVISDNQAVLIDFGAARQAVGKRNVTMTQIASAGYAPFEQYQSKGDQQGTWTDIYAMGATLYRAVTGISPQNAIDRSRAFLEASRDIYVSAKELACETYSESFLEAIDHALMFRAAERPQSVAEWRAELPGDNNFLPASESPTGLVDEKGQWNRQQIETIRTQLEKVLKNSCFVSAPQLQRLLRYLLDETLAGRGDRLNQASIAIDVLGKGAEFDAAIDSVVRVEARRLRSRLVEYYYGDGKQDTIRFELPRGQYSISIIFDPVADTPGVVESIKSVSYKVRSYSRKRFLDHFSLRKSFPVFIAVLALGLLLMAVNYYTRTDEEAALTGIEAHIQPAGTTGFAHTLGRKSVAVLPFANRSGEKNDVYFADGLHDDLLTHLSKISDMKVISRTSMMAYRNTEKNMKTIGAELGVATLVEGAVQRAGSQIHITVQLIDAQTDEYLWAEIYDRELTAANIFAIQTEIAIAIADALEATLSPEEHERIAAVPTKNLAAYDAYLLGRERLAKRTGEALAEAVDYFKKSIELDPMFALPWAGLADTYQLQVVHAGLPREQMLALAEEAINKALTLDDSSAEIYTSLGFIKGNRFDLVAAEAAFRKALDLNPNYAITYSRYAGLLRYRGQLEDAFKQLHKALELDPVSIVINTKVALYHLLLGRTEEAMAQYDKIIEIDPTSHFGYFGKAEIYTFVYGQIDKAIPWYKKTISANPDSPLFNAILGGIYLDLGDVESAACWINQAIKLGADYYWPNVFKALLHIYRAENEQALAFARQSLKFHPGGWAALQILRNDALGVGNTTQARSLYQKYYPTFLRESELTVDTWNYKAAIDLALVLQLSGEEDQAERLLERSLAVIHGNKPDFDYGGYAITNVQVYAIQGHKRQALNALRKDIDAGWRSGWWYYLKHDPNLDSIRSDVEFQSMLDEVQSDMDAQLARVKATTAEADACVSD